MFTNAKFKESPPPFQVAMEFNVMEHYEMLYEMLHEMFTKICPNSLTHKSMEDPEV